MSGITPLPCPHCGGIMDCQLYPLVVGYEGYIVHDEPSEKCDNLAIYKYTMKILVDEDTARDMTIEAYNEIVKATASSELVME